MLARPFTFFKVSVSQTKHVFLPDFACCDPLAGYSAHCFQDMVSPEQHGVDTGLQAGGLPGSRH